MCKMDIIVDMGTATTVIVDRKKGMLLSEPSLVAIRNVSGRHKVVASGNEALTLRKDKPEGVSFIYPLAGGKIANAEAASLMLRSFLERITERMIVRPQFDVMAIVSCGLHTTDRRSFEDVFYRLGIKSVTLIEAPIAAASHVVAGCSFVVIMGAGCTDIAIVTDQGIVTGCSIDISAAKLDEAIMAFVYNKYNAAISKARAADLRVKRGTLSDRDLSTTTVNAKDLLDGHMKKIDISAEDLRLAITPIINTLCEAIWSVSLMCPEHLVESVRHGGVKLYGGVSGLHYLDQYLMRQIKLGVEIHSDCEALAEGCALFFDDKAKLYRMLGINLGGRA